MAESGAAAAAGNDIGSILQNWSNVGNLFVAFIIAGLIPALKYITKTYTRWKDAKDEVQAQKEKEAITDIAKEVQQPLTDRIQRVEEVLDKFSQQNETMIDHMNIIEQLLQNGRISFQKKEKGRSSSSSSTTTSSKHFDHSSGKGDQSDYHPR